jgi:hypothetical protein
LFQEVQPDWFDQCIISGLTSGEGLIASVRDPDPDNQVTAPPGWYPEQNKDKDKRRLVVESEFAGVLRVLQREGNKLSPVIRDAWDGNTLNVLTRTDPLRATGAHISIIGHITEQELRRYLSDVEVFNGFGNRFLWVTTRRSKLLPFGGTVDISRAANLRARLEIAIGFANDDKEVPLSADARILWAEYYQDLSVEQPGLFGTMTARAEPLVLRLALIFALLDSSLGIEQVHLKAALAVWRYSEETCRRIFDGVEGDAPECQLMAALRKEPKGLTQTEVIGKVFQRNKSSLWIANLLSELENKGAICKRSELSKVGRPVIRWFCVRTNEFTNSQEAVSKENAPQFVNSLNS